MSPETIRTVRASFAAAVPAAADLTQRFYARLFTIDPTLRGLFPSDLTEQRRKLAGALAFMVASLDRPDELVPALQRLGRSHAGYGVADRHYDTVAAALLGALGDLLGEAFTAETRAAWIDVYTAAASVMKDAAQVPVPSHSLSAAAVAR
jgi:nitric oxide dioxygenase